MPDGPRFSVITIFLDAERYIREAIDSVFAQTYDSWELVLVDDGSTDGSTRIARQFAERFPDRVRYVEHAGHANRGMSASRNLGVDRASGDYVAFLDADDVYLPRRLERHAEIIARHPGVACVQSCMLRWYAWEDAGDAGRPDEPERPPAGDREVVVDPPGLLLLLLETRGGTPSGTCNLSVRRSAFLEAGGSDDSFRSHFEDQVLISKLYLRYPVVAIPDILARYRQHAASTVGHAGEATMLAQRVRYLDWLAGYLPGHGPTDPQVANALRRALFEYRHPRLFALGQMPAAAMEGLRRVGYGLLPGPLAAIVGEWWRAHKRRRADRIMDRARAKSGIRSGPGPDANT